MPLDLGKMGRSIISTSFRSGLRILAELAATARPARPTCSTTDSHVGDTVPSCRIHDSSTGSKASGVVATPAIYVIESDLSLVANRVEKISRCRDSALGECEHRFDAMWVSEEWWSLSARDGAFIWAVLARKKASDQNPRWYHLLCAQCPTCARYESAPGSVLLRVRAVVRSMSACSDSRDGV